MAAAPKKVRKNGQKHMKEIAALCARKDFAPKDLPYDLPKKHLNSLKS